MHKTRLEEYLSRGDWDKNGCLVYRSTKTRPHVRYKGKCRSAARVIYTLHTGAVVPDGFFVCHTCDNPLCINPEHLFLSTPLGNVRDCVAKGRGAKGSRSGAAKLTEKKALAIRLYAQKEASISKVASAYGLPYGIVYDVVKGKTWKHVAGAGM